MAQQNYRGMDFEQYTEGFKDSLVCDDNQSNLKIISETLRDLKYNVAVSPDLENAFDRIRYNQFDVLVLNETFGGGDPEKNELLETFQTMPVNNRRRIFLALIGNNYKTLDSMPAYIKSVNVVINVNDLPNLKVILSKAISENDQFYKVFKGIVAELGKT
ncbi:MAG: response regulator [Nitrospirae bacterium]|nr:response regulator [Nitrospirota bacterium]